MHFAPVCAATLPRASTIATCRTSRPSSFATSVRKASGAFTPPRISSSPLRPYEGSMKDCVATAPTPASAQATLDPTENQCDCTATPISPVRGSRATMEYVCTGRSGRGDRSPGASEPCEPELRPRSCAPAFGAVAAVRSAAMVTSVSIRLIFPSRLRVI
jgi:hypothetical protein